MTIIRVLATLAVAFCLGAPATAAPLGAYGKLPSMEMLSISPSGSSIAVITTDGEQRVLTVRNLSTNEVVFKARTDAAKIRQMQWAGEQDILFVTSTTSKPLFIGNSKREWSMAFALNLPSRKLRPLMQDAYGGMNTIFDAPVIRTVRGEPTVFLMGIMFSGGEGLLSVFRIDLATATSRLVEQGLSTTQDWLIGVDGKLVAHELFDSKSRRWTLRVRDAQPWRQAASANAAPLLAPYLIGLGRDANSVLYALADEKGDWTVHEARTDGATPAEVTPLLDEQSLIRDPQSGLVIGHYRLVGDDAQYTFYDPKDAKAWRTVMAAFKGDRVELESWSADRRKIAVSVDSAREGLAYAVIDLDSKRATWLGPAYADLTTADIALKQSVSFKAADGRTLSGYLTTPNGSTPKDLPLIVFPHGGPASRDAPGFDWWAQGMASRGYAVLQVNFRGSDGFGRELLEAGHGEWGRKMQTDLSDGVRHLAGQGVIDPKRVCIVGASYGGYAALAGAALDAGVYRCAVSFAGLSNLRPFIEWSKLKGGKSTPLYWNRFMGSDDSRDPILVAMSPAAQVAKIKIPILLIHGKDDTVVPLEQSRMMASALQNAGKPVEFITQNGADHWLSRGDTRLQTLTATMAFVEKHNPPN